MDVRHLSVSRAGRDVLQDISFMLHAGDHLAVTGASGSGKTSLGLALAGKLFGKGDIAMPGGGPVVWIDQQHHFKNLSNTNDLYYQQRYNSYDSEDTLTVGELLGEEGVGVLEIMQIGYLRSKSLIQLSSGENKKLQIARALQQQPSVLIMDQPFTGLDAGTRIYVDQLLSRLAAEGMTIIVISGAGEIPSCITSVLVLEEGCIAAWQDRDDFLRTAGINSPDHNQPLADYSLLKTLVGGSPPADDPVIRMKNVQVQYGTKAILQEIDWEVKAGERWLLAGPNGAGKSTLLSLVTADNPKAYANDIYLFGRKRGSGESIWDIKRKIGFLSSELHVHFDRSCMVFEAVASGLFDTIGLFRQLSEADRTRVAAWLDACDLQRLASKRLYELPAGEQRRVLLVRALVKDPPLLVLDEPCQGLDGAQQAQLLALIDRVCVQGNKTLIFVTHYHQERPACIDHLIRLEGGRVTESGPLQK